ncbi:unnamed protein product [Heterobilharzia americana]|nr:unnamed protein product [Heterobilharzia americana]
MTVKMSLTDQLRALAVPITSSYVVDNVHRKSLIYENASKIDTQSCYSNSVKSFKKLCKIESAFIPFENTLFAVTSCQLEMCNLLAQEKEKLDDEISKFLCYISSFLKHFFAVEALEWLVYKFQIHLHYVEDFIRCIIPYHETGLFVKFIQILNFKQLPTGFQWLKPYAESGKSVSRQEFTRLCLREHTLIPFICTTVISYVDHCRNLVSSRLNDMTNFILGIVTALCDSGTSEKKLIEVLDSFQDVIKQGLQSTNVIPFQCATFLIVLRFSLKLVINQELVLDWIACILKKTRVSGEWESMRIVMQLMRNQRILLLPPKLAELQSALLSKLSSEERRIIEEEQSALINDCEDPNKLAAECMQKFDYVRKATQFVDISIDNALPLLVASLSHPAAAVRVEAYDILRFWFQGDASKDTSHGSNFSIFCTAVDLKSNFVAHIDEMFSDEVRELLLGDPLHSLNRAASLLIKGVVHLLFSQPLKLDDSDGKLEDKLSIVCWMFGLRLLNEDTVNEILLIPCNQSEDSVRGWSGLLNVIRCPHEPFTDLHCLCLKRLNGALFLSLEHFTVTNDINHGRTLASWKMPSHIQTLRKKTSSVDAYHGPQFDILDALYHLGHNSEYSDFDSIHKVLSRLNLNAEHFDYMFIKSDPSRTVASDDRSLFARVAEARESRRRSLRLRQAKHLDPDSRNEQVQNKQSCSDRIRLRFLSMLLSILTEAIPRLQSQEVASVVQSKSKSNDLNTSVTTVVETRSSIVDGKKPKDQSLPMNDLITPLVNHLTSMLNMEQHLKQTALNANKTNILEESDTDSDMDSLPDSMSDIHLDQKADDISISDNNTCIRPLLRQCVYKLLVCTTAILAEGNRIKRPRRKRPHWKASADHTGLLYGLAAAQLSAMFPSALCQHLVSLVQWVACNRQLMRLDNAHNLSILGRLILVTVPALIRASSEQISAGLYVLYLFVIKFSDFPSDLSRRRLALYTVLVRGLSQVTGPFMTDSEINQCGLSKMPIDEEKSTKTLETLDRGVESKGLLRPKDSWLGSWLWVTSLIFLNKNWQTESTADEVGPFLVDLFCHFGWNHEVAGLCECLDFLIYLCMNSCDYKNRQINISESCGSLSIEIGYPQKRRKLSSSSVNPSESPTNNSSLTVVGSQSNKDSIGPSTSFSRLASFVFNSEKVVKTNELPSKALNIPNVVTLNEIWLLVNRTIQFIVVLIKTPDYCTKVQEAFKDPSGLSAVYGRLVEHIVQLMLIVATFITKVKKSDEKMSQVIACSDEALHGLQSILVQILDSVPGQVFISMISNLFASDNRGLRRKSLDLLSAKLSSLTVNIHPIPILIDCNKMNYKSFLRSHKQLVSRNLVDLEDTLEVGLVQFTGKLTSFYCLKNTHLDDSQVSKSTNVFGSSFSRQCLACLRSLAKLLAYRYPGEFMRALDSLMAIPNNWWITVSSKNMHEVSNETTGHRSLDIVNSPREHHSGSSLAESRSLACLFFVECLQRLPPQTLYPEASATISRLSWLLSFALDHACTCTVFIPSPKLSTQRYASVNSPCKSDSHFTLITSSMHSRDQHLLAGLTLISNLLEVAIIHRLCYQSKGDHTIEDTESAIGKWLEFGSSTKKKATHSSVSEPAAITLLSFLFQLQKGNLSVLTGCNPERSGHILRQISSLVNHIHQLLRHVTEVNYLLTSIQRVIEKASKESNDVILHGALSFLSDFGESMAPINENGLLLSKNEDQLHSFAVMHATQPDLIWRLLRNCLRSVVNSMNTRNSRIL